jgi:hypothetical protein
MRRESIAAVVRGVAIRAKLRLRRTLRRKECEPVFAGLSQWQLREFGLAPRPARSLHETFFNAEAQLGTVR